MILKYIFSCCNCKACAWSANPGSAGRTALDILVLQTSCVRNDTNTTEVPKKCMSGQGAPITDEPNTKVIEVPNTTEPPQPVPLDEEASEVATAEKKRGKVGSQSQRSQRTRKETANEVSER